MARVGSTGVSPRPLFPFAAPPHDRSAEHRTEEGMAAALDDQSTRVLVVSASQVAGDGAGGLLLLSPAHAPQGDLTYLGRDAGITYLAVMVDRVADDMSPQSVRELAAVLNPLEGGLLAHAIGLAAWHATHPRCSRCGAPTVAARGGHVRECPSCAAIHFPRTDPAVIMLVTDADDRALLGHQPIWPAGRYSTLAGFVEPGEPLETAVRREVAEEVGVVVGDVTYAGSQPWPFPSSLMLGFFASAHTTNIGVDGVEIASARWFSRAELAAATTAGEVALPGSLSISRWLIETWYGETLLTTW
jgi:NAD+ diphosphatase